jgi:hypothetical protein
MRQEPMKELLDIRVSEDWAHRQFGDSVGKNMRHERGESSLTRQIVVETKDPLAERLAQLFSEKKLICPAPRYVALVTREYEPWELAQAQCLRFIFTSFLNISGTQCGTQYDDSASCPRCGYGRRQISSLRLDTTIIPSKTDFTVSVTPDEWVISGRMANVFRRCGLTGYDVRPIIEAKTGRVSSDWYQMTISASAGLTTDPTRYGLNWFRDDVRGEYVCTSHWHSGLNVLSEIYLQRPGDQQDLLATTNRIGAKGGWVVPAPMIIASPKALRILQENHATGYRVEVAHYR